MKPRTKSLKTKPRARNLVRTAVLSTLCLAACSTDTAESDIESATTSAVAESQDSTTGTAATSPTTSAEPESGELSESMSTVIAGLAQAYSRTEGVWNGFNLEEHPSVVIFKDQTDRLTEVLAINHPDPSAIGNAESLSTEGTPFTSLHRITEPTEADDLAAISAFEFNKMVGGIDSFAMVAGGSDAVFDPTTTEWAATFIHEIFHRYQDDSFAPSKGFQDVDGYAYTKENLALAALEERALLAAIQATDDDTRQQAAQHLVAIRAARLAADSRVILDQDQERIEGTARFIEHQFAGTDEAYTYNGSNYDRDIPSSLTEQVKDSFGFGRFYASGAATLRVAELLGLPLDEIAAQSEAGDAPVDILSKHVNFDSNRTAELVDEAKTTYDRNSELDALAQSAAQIAEGEPSIFGDDGGQDSGQGEGGAPIELTNEQIACLNEELGPDTQDVSDAIWEKCVGT